MDRLTTGIDGLDEMLDGGIPANHVAVFAGPAGAGKTIASLQFVHANLLKGKKCLYISAGEDPESLLANTRSFGWDFDRFIDSGALTMMKPRLIEVVNLTSDFLEKLPHVVKRSNADIIIIDSITEFNDLCQTDIERRGRVLNLYEAIKESGATGILTAEAAIDGNGTRYGIADYVTDGVILLRRLQSKDLSELIHVIQISKMRWIQHSREIRQYEVTERGIRVHSKYSVIFSE